MRLCVLKGALFYQGVDIKDYSCRRSLCGGSVQYAINRQILQAAIDKPNQWRWKEAVRGSVAGLPLCQLYLSVQFMLFTKVLHLRSLWGGPGRLGDGDRSLIPKPGTYDFPMGALGV